MAPEYAMRGYLTSKADIYSYGVVALEIISGKSNTNYRPTEDCVYLLDWVIYISLYHNKKTQYSPKSREFLYFSLFDQISGLLSLIILKSLPLLVSYQLKNFMNILSKTNGILLIFPCIDL